MAMQPTTLIYRALVWNLAAGLALGSASGSPPERLAGAGATIVARAENQVGGCTASVERGVLSVFGNETANVIEFVGTADGVLLTCDGASNTYADVEEIVVEAGVGDDQITENNRNGMLGGIGISIFGQDGNDAAVVPFFEGFGPVESADLFGGSFFGGPGDDVLKIFTAARADRIHIVPGSEAGSVEVQVTDVETETPLGGVIASALEFLSVKAGDGNDEFEVARLPAIGASFFGDNGDDGYRWTFEILPFLETDSSLYAFDGGPGKDKFDLVGARAAEDYGVSGAPDRAIPDPHIQVTDMATGVVTGDFFVQHTEGLRIATGGGDDRLDLQWDAVGMSGLTAFRADLGEGHDVLTATVLPVLVAPPTGEVQTASLEIQACQGDDQITFEHAAGGWFDIALTAQLGAGEDQFRAVSVPPPDDSVPGPDGLRTLRFQVFAGNDEDFLAVANQTGGDAFELFFESELGRGDDLFEAEGLITPTVKGGRGFDTARVTRNLVPFMIEFERVETLEGGP